MDPLILLIEPDLDERAAAATMSRAQKVYEEGARDISRVMRTQLTEGTQAAGKGFEELETKARRAYLGMQDAGEKVAAAERKHEAAQERGAANAEALGRRVERARLDEIQAIERASTAYREYESAARSAGQAGERAGDAATRGMNGAATGALSAGREAAGSFVSGFAAAGPAARLAGLSVIPGVGWIAAAAAVGIAAGKVLVDNISAGMATMATRDLFQTRLGVDDATMSRYGEAAGGAFTNAWGASVEDNLRAVQFAVQGGVIDRGASNAEIEQTIGQMQALAGVMEVDVQEAARASGQLIRGDFASSGTEAANIIVSGFQRGLDISGDWLDTVTEYTTQFRKLGLDGNDALGLIQQGLQGAARDSDVVADSMKEFSIRAVDGSKLTAEGFAAIGFQADDMAARFLAGGDSARGAFDATLQAIKGLDDPIQQALTWQALFGTQWEDMGDAINKMDLSTARTEFGSTDGAIDEATRKLSEHVNQWEVLGRTWDTQFAKLKEWLADSDIGKFFGSSIPTAINDILSGPGGPGIAAIGEHPDDIAPTPLNPLDILVPTATLGRPQSARDLLMPSLAGPPMPGYTPAGPAPVPGDRSPILTDTQKEAAEAAGGGTSLPTAPSLPLQYTATAGLPTQIANATTRLDEARHEVAEKEARVNQLRQSNLADETDIQKAENDLTKAGQDQLQAERALNDARISATEKQTKQVAGLSSELGEFGAQLDKDFGISKGLGGIMENVTRFLGNLIAAPFLQALGMVAKANPNEGSGMTGILAANGAFGQQYTPGAISASSMGTAGYGGGTAIPGGTGGAPTEAQVKQIAAAFGLQVTSEDRPGDPGYHGQGMALDVSNGSGNTEQQRAFAEYMSQNFGSSLKELIYSDGSFSGLIGDGKNVTGTGYYSSGTLDEHQNHVHVAADWGSGGNGGFGGASGAGPVPVSVVNGPGGSGAAGSFWDAVAAKESGGNWQNQDTGKNGHFGGLQFSPSTWNAFGGVDLTGQSNPANATREQQIAIADRTAFTGYNGTAPQGLGAWEVITNGSTAPDGITVNSPRPGGSPGVTGPASLPTIPAGAGGQGYMGLGGPTPLGGQAYPAGPKGGGLGMSGGLMDAAMMGTSAMDMMMPGAGAAAKVGIQLANRTIKYAGQMAGIGVSGLMQTFTPAGDNPKASIGNSWFGKLAGGLAGAAPALPNQAGGKTPGALAGQQGQQGQGGAAGNTINNTVNLTNNRATEDMAGNQAVREMGAMSAQPGKQ